MKKLVVFDEIAARRKDMLARREAARLWGIGALGYDRPTIYARPEERV